MLRLGLQKPSLRSSTLTPGIFFGPGVTTLAWVDNFLIGGTGKPVTVLKTQLEIRFKTKYLGYPTHYVGMQIQHNNGSIAINLKAYLLQGLEKQGMTIWRLRWTQM